MWIMPAVVIVGLLLTLVVCGARAVLNDLRARRWIWALAGTIATVTGTGAAILVASFASLTAPLGL
ncbi:MAG TPA: hypothetical protein VI168_18345 [Croceibacterium sp.]